MVLTALRGAVGFLSRIPVGNDERAWNAFKRSPVAFPLAGYVIGALVAVTLLLPAPAPTVAAVFVCWLYLLTGITHLDGLADIGDALVVHGSSEERQAVLKDTTAGVGAVFAVVVLLVALALAAIELASNPLVGVGIVVAAEVAAKLSMVTVACLGSATHEGLGSQFTATIAPRDAFVPTVVALPAATATWPHPAAAVSLVAGVSAAFVVLWIARQRLGGVNGDVFGAGNEIARVVALHAGVIAWTQF